MFAFYFWLYHLDQNHGGVSLGLSLPIGGSGGCCIPAGENGGVKKGLCVKGLRCKLLFEAFEVLRWVRSWLLCASQPSGAFC